MSFYDLCLGLADSPGFQWEGGSHSGNIPRSIINFGAIGLVGCCNARSLLESPKYGGKVLDWGASGARLSKERVAEFFVQFYGEEGAQHEVKKLKELPDDQLYVLYACET